MKEEKNNSIETFKNKNVSPEELEKQLQAADVGQKIGSGYFTLEPGEQARVIFVEMSKMNGIGDKKDEMIDCVSLYIPKEATFKKCADKVVISALRDLHEKGKTNIPIQILCTGTVKSSNGYKYKEFEINELIIK